MTSKRKQIKTLPGAYVKCPTALLGLLGDGVISPTELCLWLVVRCRCVKGSECYPSASTLAKTLNCRREYIYQLQSGLEAKALLKVKRRRGQSPILVPMLPAEPVNSSSHVDAENLLTPVHTGCEVQLTSPVNSSSHINRCSETDEPKQSVRQPSAAPSVMVPETTPKQKKSKPRKETDPRIKQLIDHFSVCHLDKFGHKYVVSGARDGQLFKALLTDHDLETLQTCIDAFFADADEWLNGKRTVPVFRSRINTYVQQLSQKIAAPTPAAHQKWRPDEDQ